MLRGKVVPLVLATLAVLAVVTASALATGSARVHGGSNGADVLRGVDTADRIFGFGGNDRLFGYGGADAIVGGTGNDVVVAGNGGDRIDVRDGARDVVYCGGGYDVVSRDARDDAKPDCERSTSRPLAVGATPKPTARPVKDAPPKGPAAAGKRRALIVVSIGGSGKVRSVPAGIDCPARCRARFRVGTKLRLVAAPNAGQARSAWGGACRGTKPTCTLVARSAIWIRANFVGTTSPPPPAPAPPAPPPPSAPSGQVAIRVDEAFVCNGPVDLDLVRITMRTKVDDALRLDQNCTGRIRRLEIETWTADGIKVQNRGSVAHDLVIESGYVKCHAIAGAYHQDGVQAMGGLRITFRNLAIDCLGNSNFFLARGGSGAVTPTDIVCEGCILGPNSGQTLFYATSIRSGVVNTRICEGRFRAVRIERDPVDRIDRNNTILPRGHPACANVTGR